MAIQPMKFGKASEHLELRLQLQNRLEMLLH